MAGFPGDPVRTSGGGFYSAKVPVGWDGTVTPSKAGYEFEPDSITYTDVGSDQPDEDYTPEVVHIISESFEVVAQEPDWYGYDEGGWIENVEENCILDEDSTIPGAPPVDFGSQCLKSVSNAPGYKASAELMYGSEQARTYTTFYVYVESEGLPDGSDKNIAALKDGDGNVVVYLRLWKNSSGVLRFRFRVYNDGGFSNHNSAAISPGSWYKIEFKYDNIDHYWGCEVEDAPVHAYYLLGAHRSGVRRWKLGFFTSSSEKTGTVYFDELKVSTVSLD
jgi:hypothetical protein